jgi:hypothetical protein
MEQIYRIILQINTENGPAFKLFDKEKGFFTVIPVIETQIKSEDLEQTEQAARAVADGMLQGGTIKYLVWSEEIPLNIPGNFRFIEPKPIP